MPLRTTVAVVLISGFPGFCLQARAQEASPTPGLGAIAEIAFSQLSDQTISEEGRRALAIRPERWKHGETAHFVLHFTSTSIATPVSVEAEFYFRVITAELQIAPPSGSGKNHLYIFEAGEDWEQFIRAAKLEDWTGAVTIGNELFVPRNPQYKFKGNALGHEIAHLLVNRYLGDRLPLWLSEGYAEDVSLRGYAAFYRARGYNARPAALGVAHYIPLKELTAIKTYPSGPAVEDFYRESRRLAGFLNRFGSKQPFIKLLGAMAKGAPFEAALHDAYGSRWFSIDDLDAGFKKHLLETKP